MFIAQSWEKGVLNKFGSNVGRLPIFQRVMRYLKTEGSATLVLDCILKLGGHAFFRGGFFSETPVLAFTPIGPGGRQEILACAKSATPLHGKNGAEGVKECSQLVVELQKLRDAATAAATAAAGRV